MVFEDPAQAEHCLRHVQYYRLVAYWLPFEADHSTHRFRAGTTFAQVWNLYVFDRELRLLVLDAIERVEVSVRSQWAYVLAHRHGPHAHLDPALAYRRDRWRGNREKLEEEVRRSDEIFIRHLLERYSDHLPPIWAVCEVMSLGQLSRWYDSLKPMATRTEIADGFGFDQKVLERFLHHLTIVRNVCAHHSRLWNREFTIIPSLPRTKPADLPAQLVNGSRRLYNTLALLIHPMSVVAPGNHWRSRLLALLTNYSIDPTAMGFPRGWEQFPIWREDVH